MSKAFETLQQLKRQVHTIYNTIGGVLDTLDTIADMPDASADDLRGAIRDDLRGAIRDVSRHCRDLFELTRNEVPYPETVQRNQN